MASTAKAKLPAWKSSELAIFAQAAATENIFTGDETSGELEEKARVASVALLSDRRRSSQELEEEDIMLRSGVQVRTASDSEIRPMHHSSTSIKSGIPVNQVE